jgi:glyoxylase-like metal-dependent hydrolase (beta-lactamase superfamily II)
MVPSFTTPDGGSMDARQTIDVDLLRTGVERMIADGVDVLATTGTFGEVYNLLWEEQQVLIKAMVEVVAKRVPLFIGCTSPNPREVLDKMRFIREVGADGVLVVDTGDGSRTDQLLAAIRKLSDRPIRWIVNTHFHPDHTGGNGPIAKAGRSVPQITIGAGKLFSDADQTASIVAHENVLNRLTASADRGQPLVPEEGMPVDEYFTPVKNLHFNDEAIVLYHEPKAHTDGDSLVLFRGSDVLSTGDIFTPGAYPFIDVDQGGTVQGEIAALTHILQLTVPAKNQEGGTYVVPGHGRICDSADVVEFRDMVVIVRDRIQDLMKKGMTLDQIKAAGVTRDYDTEYVTPTSFVKPDQFVASMYKSLGGK